MLVRTHVPLAPLTTLRLGGRAARLAEVECEEDVVDAVRDGRARGEPLFVLGAGSNVVVVDEGFHGLVARMAIRGVEVRREADRVLVDVAAGEPWDELVARAVDEGWRGVECMSGVPGLVGATPVQNVGAYGQEVCETILGVRAYDRDAGAFVEMDARACGFAYRTSVFRGTARWIVTRVRFVLALGGGSVIRYPELARALTIAEGGLARPRQVRETVLALRRAKAMVLDDADPDSVSAGSFFTNPIVSSSTVRDIAERAGAWPPHFVVDQDRRKVAAAWLIERAGFVKGWGQGRVGVSSKHALALVNRGGASAGDLLAVARHIRDAVRMQFGVTLHPEPVLLGGSWQALGLE